MPNRKGGFTQLELIVVLAIMGLSAALVVPRLAGSLQNAQIKAALRDASNLMRRARVHSVLERKEYQVVVDRQTGTLSLQQPETPDGDPPQTLSDVQLPKDLNIASLDSAFSRKKKQKQENWVKKYLTFYPMGNSSGGSLHLTDGRERHYTIEINPFTGRVSILNESNSNT
jgi:general secretion pathway protein H